MTKEELKKISDNVLEQFPNANEVYATADGNVFLEENRARLHAKGGIVIPFERELTEDVLPGSKRATVANTVKWVLQAKTLEELESFEDDDRAGVIKAVETQRQKLNEETSDTVATDNTTKVE